jgi:hypothetical protein
LNLRCLATGPDNGAYVGSGTAAITVGLLVERKPVAAPSILASEHFIWFATIVAGITVRVEAWRESVGFRALSRTPNFALVTASVASKAWQGGLVTVQ